MKRTLNALADMHGVDLIHHLQVDHADLADAIYTTTRMVNLTDWIAIHEAYHQDPPYELDHNHQ